MPRTRLITSDDIPELTDLLTANRDFLEPWEPERDDEYFTISHQDGLIGDALERHALGSVLPHVITGDAGELVGRITLSGITRWSFMSCSVGFWVS